MSTLPIRGARPSRRRGTVRSSLVILFVFLVAAALFGVWQFFRGAVERAVYPVREPAAVAPR